MRGNAELAPVGGDIPGIETLQRARDGLSARFDARWGGFGPAPKFPQTDFLEALLINLHVGTRASELSEAQKRTNAHTLAMITTTLDAMASGGIYDHLGGGFARYSVDDQWLVPHFEKMLYDQALLARIYLHAWQVTDEPRYLQVVSETIDYVRRHLRHPDGGFFSSEDADSEGSEGRFYVWSMAEIEALLGPASPEALAWWGVTPGGNFEGTSILYRPERGTLARSESIERSRQVLFDARERRVRPGLDDKVLTEWNCLFLATLAEAAAATGRTDWLDEARTNADFLLRSLRRPDGRWLRSWQAGRAGRHLAVAADYAAAVDAFTRLAEATGEAGWIEAAKEVADAMIELFWDDQAGGLFTTASDSEALITRVKDVIDGAIPSANSNAAVALLRLGALVGNDSYNDRAHDILRLLALPLNQHPTAFTRLLLAVGLANGLGSEVVITGERPDLVAVAHRLYLPLA
ncbi:MAG: thioredoxin domain-containing protein, partial [Pseudonocardiaceae bacterium]